VLTVTNAFGCSSAISKQLSSAAFRERPEARFSTSPVICEGTEVRFTDQSTPAPGSRINNWSWNFSVAGSSVEQDPTVLFRQAGAFPVGLVVTDENGCQSNAGEIPTIITVHPQPKIDAGASQYVAQGTRVRLTASAKQPELLNLHWSPDFVFTGGTILSPEFLAQRDQKFTLTASDNSGFCTAMDTVSVYVLRPVKVPNVFSPNGDGINDQWQIPNLSTYFGCEVNVYNRYGQPVFGSKGYATPWDGKINGVAAPVATYYYIIDLKNGFGRLTGSVTIVR
jgi:gliding motility-associated-like protein